MATMNEDLLRSFYEAFDRRDIDGIRAMWGLGRACRPLKNAPWRLPVGLWRDGPMYGWHATGHGSEGHFITVPACPNGDEALILSNSGPGPRDVKVYINPGPKVTERGTDTAITAVATCDPNAIPLPGRSGRR
ncbi:MAG: hypothetical protein H0V96_04235 [Acidimicrobiia bacterium]|nr:hypothetical protein [Acidimicrobiia bacterium]